DGRGQGRDGLPLRDHRAPGRRAAAGRGTGARGGGAAPDRRPADRSAAVTLDPDTAQAAIEYCYDQGWSDGLPLVPASRPLVDAFLAQTSRSPEEVIGHNVQVDRDCTVELAAINAAMAGCRPEYFPVVLAAWEALMRDRAAGGGGWQSTSGPA